MTEQNMNLAANADATRSIVLLRHDLPDGDVHFDWFIATDSKERLISFRVAKRIDLLKADESLEATHMADHRAIYLDYEGPISDGRGRVKRVRKGAINAAASSEVQGKPCWRLQIRWEQSQAMPCEQTLTIANENDGQWIITCVTMK